VGGRTCQCRCRGSQSEDAGELYVLCSPEDHDHDHDDHRRREIKPLTEPSFFFDVVHATLALLIRLSPFYLCNAGVPLLSILQVGE
jgi:hypothetical protein